MPDGLASAATRCSLQGLFTGDALSMPVHWFYRPADILRAFPPTGIYRMEAAPATHPSSIMSLHSTAVGGRKQHGRRRHPPADVVGELILKGRRRYWDVAGTHYHHGLPAGENTLNAWCARWLMEYLLEVDEYDAEAWIGRYIERMTADPAAHPDTYAESYHRGFFANLVAGVAPMKAGAVTHDTPSMGALVTVAPLALALLGTHPLDEVQAICRRHVAITHPDELLLEVVSAYVRLLARIAGGARGDEFIDALVEAASVIPGTRLDRLLASGRADAELIGPHWSLACYITDSWPSVCWLAARHHRHPDRALLVNTNLGGENAHRGAVLGTLVSPAAELGPTLFDQLYLQRELGELIERFVTRFV